MDNIKTPMAFDDYTEVLSEQEMDQDLKKALKEMTEGISALLHHAAHATESGTQSTREDSAVEGKLEKLDERSNWHRNIGWGIAGLYGAAFLVIMTWWIPREVTNARTGITADTAAQLLPIQLQLAKLTALMELKQSKDVAQAIHESANFATPRPAIEAIKTIAQQAKADKLVVPPSVLQQANATIENAVSNDPKLSGEAWSARLALVDYRSALEQPFEGNVVSGIDKGLPFPDPKLPMVQKAVLRDGRQKRDGAFWKDMIFENMQVEYDGGPIAMQNVRFINCTFLMRYTPRADMLANWILDQKNISGSLS